MVWVEQTLAGHFGGFTTGGHTAGEGSESGDDKMGNSSSLDWEGKPE